MTPSIDALPGVPANQLGESPCWHPTQQVLYWCDIPAHELHRFDPSTGQHRHWRFDTDVSCCAPLLSQGRGVATLMLLALRTGLAVFDTATAKLEPIADTTPYDPANERFNDGKADPMGRLWVGSMYEPRTAPNAALFRFDDGVLVKMAGNATIANGLAWSPDARRLYWADTTAHRIDVFDFDVDQGTLANRRVFAAFALKASGEDPSTSSAQALAPYGGRPDGAAMDSEGFYWAAMFEGARLVRIAPDGRIDCDVPLPVRCPTMPAFGDADLKTIYVTTASHKRPADELAREPLAGCVLRLRVDVPGLPCNVARL